VPTRTGIEPFQIKTVEPLRWTTREEREPILARAHHNVVLIPSDEPSSIPRRVYTQSHMDYVVEIILEVWKRFLTLRRRRPWNRAAGALPRSGRDWSTSAGLVRRNGAKPRYQAARPRAFGLRYGSPAPSGARGQMEVIA
jgi:hypothetical protein